MNILVALACAWDLRRLWIVPSTLWIGRLKVCPELSASSTLRARNLKRLVSSVSEAQHI